MSRKKCPLNENSVGGRLRIYREASNFKLVDFAKKLGISHGSLSEIENNKTKPSSDPLQYLIHETDINIYWLYTGEGSMRRKGVEVHQVESPKQPETANHTEIISMFQDPVWGRNNNMLLVQIERMNPNMRSYI